MTDHDVSEKMVGECGVCGNSLPVGANHAFTVCKHLFCISCLLRWHKASTRATCPMCRAPLELEPAADDDDDDDDDAAAFEMEVSSRQLEQEQTRITLEEMDLNQDEESMHDHMMMIAGINASEYCLANPMCTYMGSISLHPIRDQDYHGIEVGIHNVNCHYVIELRDSPRAFRYKFGRIEDITMMHPMFQGISWFVFRELIETLDVDTGDVRMSWSQETQRSGMQGGDVKSLRQYVPRMRMIM